MMTSQEWWNGVKADPAKFDEWLIKQYRGEVTAAVRIRAVSRHFHASPEAARTLETIALQEETHAQLVAGLLRDRGIVPMNVEQTQAEARYWKAARENVKDLETACAVGAHAENMRLERIRVICNDVGSPTKVRNVFRQILTDEVWHEKAFRKLAGEVAMAETRADHEAGRKLLGLVA